MLDGDPRTLAMQEESMQLASEALAAAKLSGDPGAIAAAEADERNNLLRIVEENDQKRVDDNCGGEVWCHAKFPTGCNFKRLSDCNGDDAKLIESKRLCAVAADMWGFTEEDGEEKEVNTPTETEAAAKGCYVTGGSTDPKFWFNEKGTTDPEKLSQPVWPICCSRTPPRTYLLNKFGKYF